MQKKFESKIEMVDQLDDIKSKVSFMSIAISEMFAAPDFKPGDSVLSGMYVIFREIKEQVNEVSEAIRTEAREDRPPKVTNALGSILDPAPGSKGR